MAVKGAVSKNIIFNKLMEVFSNSFWEDEGKILRIPMDEDGNRVEIKVSLTAAKNLLGETEVNSAFSVSDNSSSETTEFNEPTSTNIELTEEEKNNVVTLLNSLNF